VIRIRNYVESRDAHEVGQLIKDTFADFNLTFASPEEKRLFLGPFQYAESPEAAHQEAIANVIRAEMVLVAEEDGEIAGVLRGRKERLQSLFVKGSHHRRGIGRELVSHFERACRQQGALEIKVAATLFAVPFYQKLGYKRTTGVRSGHSFEGTGLPYQPMKKVLDQVS